MWLFVRFSLHSNITFTRNQILIGQWNLHFDVFSFECQKYSYRLWCAVACAVKTTQNFINKNRIYFGVCRGFKRKISFSVSRARVPSKWMCSGGFCGVRRQSKWNFTEENNWNWQQTTKKLIYLEQKYISVAMSTICDRTRSLLVEY